LIPVSIIITTYNEAQNLARCLAALKDFEDVIVVDSNSTDNTKEIALTHGAHVENFTWNGAYPKKRQYCLDNIKTKHDYIFFVDGDEEVTSEVIDEIRTLDFKAAGYFVKGQYIWQGQILKYGLQNNKLVLFDKTKVEFPKVDDLDIEGMGEIEGHYQPTLKYLRRENPLRSDCNKIEKINAPLLHFAYEDAAGWHARHVRYAKWEAVMIKRNAYPKDPVRWREVLKFIFRRMPLRGFIAFCHSYIGKRGFLDGRAGYGFAKSRAHYYKLVQQARIIQP
jgi:glycosyltransferase involved in cell wall biosynthesis